MQVRAKYMPALLGQHPMDMRAIINLVETGHDGEPIMEPASVPLAATATNEISRAKWFGTYIAYMSPDEYTALARRRRNPPPLPNNLGGNMDRLRASIEAHGLQTLPWLTISGDQIVSQEGLHRAAVLQDMGYERIPVRIFAQRGGDHLSQDEAEEAYRRLVG
jgi:hypothetical protein